jgi:hypothetical protein
MRNAASAEMSDLEALGKISLRTWICSSSREVGERSRRIAGESRQRAPLGDANLSNADVTASRVASSLLQRAHPSESRLDNCTRGGSRGGVVRLKVRFVVEVDAVLREFEAVLLGVDRREDRKSPLLASDEVR